MEQVSFALSTRQKIVNDCRLIARFARGVVEAAVAKNEKAVTNSLRGGSRDELLQYLNALVEHLREARSPDDLPGDCEEAHDLRLYALAALGRYIERVGDPVLLASICVSVAHPFLQRLIDRDVVALNGFLGACGDASSLALRFLTAFGHFQLKGAEWVGGFLSGHLESVKSDGLGSMVGEWMRREVRGVETLAKRLNCRPSECAEEYWRLHEKECALAALFPRSLCGYKTSISLRQVFLRREDLRNHKVSSRKS